MRLRLLGVMPAMCVLMLPLSARAENNPAEAPRPREESSRPAPDQLPDAEPATYSGHEEFGGSDATRPGTYTLRALIQTRLRQTVPDAAEIVPLEEELSAQAAPGLTQNAYNYAKDNDGLRLERVFLRVTAAPTKSFNLKLLADFGELIRKNEKRALKLAFGELEPARGVTVTAGLFKVPFSLLELLPIAEYEFADVGPTDDLIKDLGFGGRDVGAMVDIAPFKKKRRFHVSAGIFQGDSLGAQSYGAPGLVAARASVRPSSHMELGADCVYRWHPVTDLNDAGIWVEKYSRGAACSADGSLAYKRFALRGEWMTGKRTDTPLHPDGKSRSFMAAWGIASYKIRLRKKMSLIPALRVEWVDEDRLSPLGATTFLSAALSVEFTPGARLTFDLSRSNVQLGTRPRDYDAALEGSGLPPGVFRMSATTGVVQLQVLQ